MPPLNAAPVVRSTLTALTRRETTSHFAPARQWITRCQKPRHTSIFLHRSLHTSTTLRAAPKSRDRGPKSDEDTQTDFSALDILSNTPPPTTAVDACIEDGFALDSGLRINGAGVLLVGGEAFKWRPWMRSDGTGDLVDITHPRDIRNMTAKLKNAKGMWEVEKHVWGVLDLAWPKPDILIVGTGSRTIPLSMKTRAEIGELGVRIEVQDTRNAAAQYNMLATERGVQQIAAALVPVGWDGQ